MALIGSFLKLVFLITFFECTQSVPASSLSLSANHHNTNHNALSVLIPQPQSSSEQIPPLNSQLNAESSEPIIFALNNPTDTSLIKDNENTTLSLKSQTIAAELTSNKIDDLLLKKKINANDGNDTMDLSVESMVKVNANSRNNSVDSFDSSENDDDIDAELRGKPYEEQVDIYYRMIYEHIAPKKWTWVLIACHVLVFVVGLLGNALVCVAVYRNYAMRTVTNYFIVNLAVADFLVILLCLPPTLVWDVASTWFFGDCMCKIVLYLQTVSVTVSVLTLTFISIDRWYAICYPLRFKSTTRRAQTAICVIWLVSLCLDIPELIVNETRSYNHKLNIQTVYFTQCVPTWSARVERNMQIARMLLLYFLPLMLMSIFYVQIIRVLWQSGTVTHNGIAGRHFNFSMVSNASTRGQLRSRKKAAKMLVSVVGMFAFCYFPVHLLSLLRLMVRLDSSDVNNALAMISHWLCYANSALNPIIYNFMSEKFRKEFQRTIHCTSRNQDSRVELNAIWKTQLRKALSSSLGRSDTNRTTVTSTT